MLEILIAEDDQMSLDVLETMLDQWAYTYVSCMNGAEAWQILQRDDAPKVGIFDWNMPEMDGLELCRNAKNSGKDIYIIMLTARGAEEEIEQLIGAGADDYVRKPCSEAELFLRVRAAETIVQLRSELQEAEENPLRTFTYRLKNTMFGG